MPTRLTRSRLSRLAAGLTFAAPALAAAGVPGGTPEGVVRVGDARSPAVTPVSAEAGPGCPPGGAGVGVPGVPLAGSALGVGAGLVGHGAGLAAGGAGLVAGHVGPHLAKLRPHGYITWAEIGAGLRAKPALIPPLGGYDAYLPPDYGWQAPIAYPVQRVPVKYHDYYPAQWYGLPGSQKARVAPTVFMPTDTTQLGYYHQQVPTWQPAAAGSFPAPPDPRTLHRRECPAGPNVGVHPGIYPGEDRRFGCRRDPVTGRLHGPVDVHTPHGGTIVTEPALPSCPADGPTAGPAADGPAADGPAADGPVNYEAELFGPDAPEAPVRPLPSSTDPLPGDADPLPAPAAPAGEPLPHVEL